MEIATRKRIAVTGHRPQHLRLDDGYWVQREYARLMTKLDPQTAISGMALGADSWWAAETRYHETTALYAYVPFPEQDARWREDDRVYYRQLLKLADEVITVCETYRPEAFQLRNVAMVDNCDVLIATWNGKNHGGTWNCLQYALQVGRPVVYCDPVKRRTYTRKSAACSQTALLPTN